MTRRNIFDVLTSIIYHLTFAFYQCAKRQFGALDFACLQLVENLLELLSEWHDERG